ncbi:MAG TPA: hypothetical protein VI749_05170 [Candidatus Omnitrophota bacterium]|nr:hypothetical protein [Candidatus Omnitrophota bacterium]
MRVLLKIELPTEKANTLASGGLLGGTIKTILDEQKPEAAYFIEMNGRRTGIIVLNLAEESQIPATVEPWFLAFNASVEIHPAMVLADLAKGGAAIDKAAKKYGNIPVAV